MPLRVLAVRAWVDWHIGHSVKGPVFRPIVVPLPESGIAFAESVHGPGFRMADRVDPFHKILYVLQGQIEFSEAHHAKARVAGRGAAICVNANVRHRFTDTQPSTLLLLYLAPGFVARDSGLQKLWQQVTRGSGSALQSAGAWGSRFEALWRSGVVEQSGQRPGREVALQATAAGILVTFARLPAETLSDLASRRVATVVRELAVAFFEPWSLDRASARAGISRRYFSRLFHQQTGRTFLEHLTELRLTHAARLLSENRHSIVGAAFSSGYGDLSHFYRLFRARFGHPPREWLERQPSRRPYRPEPATWRQAQPAVPGRSGRMM